MSKVLTAIVMGMVIGMWLAARPGPKARPSRFDEEPSAWQIDPRLVETMELIDAYLAERRPPQEADDIA